MRRLLLLLIPLLALPASALAVDGQRCWLISTTSALDISSGAVTTSELIATPGGTTPQATTPIPEKLKIGVDLTDADDGVTNIQLTFTAAETTGGTFRNVPLCIDSAPTLTCGSVDLDWNPQTYGKNWWLYPIPWGYPYGKITVTPTGHGASDTVVLNVYGCGS